jgi:hypothetical protein
MTTPDEDKLERVQQKIDEARHQLVDHGVLPEDARKPRDQSQDTDQDGVDDDQEEVIDGLTRPGLG